MNVRRMGTLTLQEVGCQEGGRGVRAGQTLLQKVSLKLQGKQVARRREKHRSQAQGPWDTHPHVEEDTQPGCTEQTVPRQPGPTALSIHTAGGTPHPGAPTTRSHAFKGAAHRLVLPVLHRHNRTHSFVGSGRKSQQGQSIKCGCESQRDG